MTDSFEIPVTYNDEELIFTGRLINYGFIHKIEVDINGQTIQLEPDEERNYRAIVDASTLNDFAGIDKGLLQQIIAVIEFAGK